jgi:hypothetical protein
MPTRGEGGGFLQEPEDKLAHLGLEVAVSVYVVAADAYPL